MESTPSQVEDMPNLTLQVEKEKKQENISNASLKQFQNMLAKLNIDLVNILHTAHYNIYTIGTYGKDHDVHIFIGVSNRIVLGSYSSGLYFIIPRLLKYCIGLVKIYTEMDTLLHKQAVL